MKISADPRAQWQGPLLPGQTFVAQTRKLESPPPLRGEIPNLNGLKPSSQVDAQHHQNRTRLADVVSALVADLRKEGVSHKDLGVHVAKRLPEVLENNPVIDPDAYEPGAHYEKVLLYNHPDKQHPFSIWGFVFGEGHETIIHDHQCECVSFLLAGNLREQRYEEVGQRGNIRYAKLTSDCHRLKHHAHHLTPGESNIHSLSKDTPGKAMTVHVYTLDADAPKNSSVRYAYQTLPNDLTDLLGAVEE